MEQSVSKAVLLVLQLSKERHRRRETCSLNLQADDLVKWPWKGCYLRKAVLQWRRLEAPLPVDLFLLRVHLV